ncbi:MAG: hypothetical protein AB7N61_20625 [Acidimicrobiia bacterium]
MNASAHAGFDAFYNESYALVVDLLADVFDSTTIALDEARSSFASTYRFWNKIGPRDDPLEWTLTDAFSRQRRRWTDHSNDTTGPTVGHSATVLRRHGFTDAQLRNFIGPSESVNLTDDPHWPTEHPVDLDVNLRLETEKRIVVSLARRRKVVAAAVLASMVAIYVAIEIFIARG